jgi:hypothetical protein
MKIVGKIVICVVAYISGVMLSGMITGALHLPSPGLPPGVTTQQAFVASLFGTSLLVVGLVPLAMGMGGSKIQRGAAIGTVVFIAIAVNTMIEAKVFTSFISISLAAICAHYVLPCLFLSIALAVLFSSAGKPMGLPTFTPIQWTWRILVAWLAFPVIYLIFGMCVAPFVTEAYITGVAGLKLPSMTLILKVQAVRSLLFLASSLPIVLLWAGSRRDLLIKFGIAEAMMVGVHGLAFATWFPTILRWSHSIEITCDSFVYVAVLVWLFAARAKKPVQVPATASIVAA